MEVFYSWQTDAPRKINKNFIYKALCNAAEILNETLDLSEAQRDQKQDNVNIDQDTQGVLGSPSIAQVIYEKIQKSDIVVADVSLVAKSSSKKHINSNVAIELGYALGKNGSNCLIKIMNTAYGNETELPFDLRDRRHPTTYMLPENATKVEIETELKTLTIELVSILKLYFKNAKNLQEDATHERVSPSFHAAAFWDKDAALAVNEGTDVKFKCNGRKLISARCIPLRGQKPLTLLECDKLVRKAIPFADAGSIYYRTNYWGAIVFSTEFETTFISHGTQVFKNREIWGFSPEVVYFGQQNDRTGRKYCLITDYWLMKYLPDALENIKFLADQTIVGEYELNIIAADLNGVGIPKSEYESGPPHQISEDTIEISFRNPKEMDSTEMAYSITEKIYAEAGIEI